jgi:hypothetical protein
MIVQEINQDSKTILDLSIHEDDTIEMIKVKASKMLGCQPHEIYLFAQQRRQMNVHMLYEELIRKTEIIVKEDVEHLLADLSKEKSITYLIVILLIPYITAMYYLFKESTISKSVRNTMILTGVILFMSLISYSIFGIISGGLPTQ